MAGDEIIRPEDILLAEIPSGRALPFPSDEPRSLKDAKAHFERELILQTLEAHQWNITRAAEALQIERSHLHRKLKLLKLLGIRPPT